MKNIFNNKVNRTGDNESDDYNIKNNDKTTEQGTSSILTAQPAFYYHPPSTSSTTSSYSHTASSTAGYSQKNAYPTLTNYYQDAERKNLTNSLESVKTSLPMNAAVPTTNNVNPVTPSGLNARDLLQNGTIVQLVSKSSGHLIQVVMSSTGALVFDGNGTPSAFNVYFNVETSEQGRVRFHNNYNYLAFDNKQPCIMSFPPGPKNNSNIDFRVHDIHGTNEVVAFESCAFKNHFISITPDGLLKTSHIKEKTIDAQFSIVPFANNVQPMFPYYSQPHQAATMNLYNGLLPNNANEPVSPPVPMYHKPATTSLPVFSSTQFSQPSTSSGLYPHFN